MGNGRGSALQQGASDSASSATDRGPNSAALGAAGDAAARRMCGGAARHCVVERGQLLQLQGRVVPVDKMAQLREKLAHLFPGRSLDRASSEAAQGRWEEMLDGLLEESENTSDAMELVEIALDAVGIELPATVGASNQFVEAAVFQIEGFAELIRAHEAGNRQALAMNYAQAWAELVAGAAVGARFASAGSSGDPALDDARHKGRQDGLATLSAWGESGTRRYGEVLRRSYGSEDNARHALCTELVERAGYEGLKFHDGK